MEKTMARYCSYCGKPLADNDLFCGYCGTKVTQKSQYARTETMSQAYELAKQRNDTDWSYWDSPTLFTYSPRKVEKFCIKEDKYRYCSHPNHVKTVLTSLRTFFYTLYQSGFPRLLESSRQIKTLPGFPSKCESVVSRLSAQRPPWLATEMVP